MIKVQCCFSFSFAMAAKEIKENVVFLPLEIVKNSVGFSFDIGKTCCWLVRHGAGTSVDSVCF